MRALQMVAQECDRMTEEYRKLLGLVAQARAGEVDIRDVAVDLLGLSWRYDAGSGPRPEEMAAPLALAIPDGPAPTVAQIAEQLLRQERGA